MRKLTLVVVLALLVAGFSWSPTYAKSEYVNSLTTAYPNTGNTPLAACATCHTPKMELNVYGAALSAAKLDFKAIEGKDSDGDGATNAAEIAALTNPGDASSKPAGSGSGSGSSGSSSGSASYRDIAGNPAKSAIEALVKAGVLAGGGSYRPGAAITRVEFACLLQRLFQLPGTTPYLAAFSDVPKTYWAYSTIEAIVRSGLMTSEAAGKFNPSGTVTRAAAARSTSIALGHGADVASLPDADCLAYAAKEGLFGGSSGPTSVMTRGDAAILLAKVLTAKSKMADPLGRHHLRRRSGSVRQMP